MPIDSSLFKIVFIVFILIVFVFIVDIVVFKVRTMKRSLSTGEEQKDSVEVPMASIVYAIPDRRQKKKQRRKKKEKTEEASTSQSEEKELLTADKIVIPNGMDDSSFAINFLSALHPHPLDETIKFVEDTHKYYVRWHETPKFDDGSDTLSVSGVIKKYSNEFDAQKIAQKIVNGGKHDKPGSKYHGMSVSEIVESWAANGKKASETGTKVHLLFELFLNGLVDLRKDFYHFKVVRQFLAWYDGITADGLIPYRTELRMRTDVKTQITGTADGIFVRADHPAPEDCDNTLTLTIFDWKNSKEIKTHNRWQSMKGLMSDFDDCNLNKYSIQQNFYAYMMEHQRYGGFMFKGRKYKKTKIDSASLVVVHDNREEAGIYKIGNMRQQIAEMMTEREEELKKKRASK